MQKLSAHLLGRRKILAYLSRLPNPVLDFVCTIAPKNVKSNIRKLEKECKTLEDYFNLIRNAGNFLLPISLYPSQKEYEILTLLEEASRRGLRFITDIGTGRGGTFYLLCKAAQAHATIITLDITMPSWLKRLLESYAQPGQTAIVMKANSHAQKTVRRVKELLRGNKLDLLFVDGDHSYEGVKQDFLNYSRLVRKGGWIAFHDIIPDRQTSYGICTESWTGDVPKFYNQIKRHWNHFEIVENPNQNGWGIGVLIWE